MKRLTHYIGIGRAGMIVQFPDSEMEPCKDLALQLCRAANAVARNAVIEHERADTDPAQTAATLAALEVLTGFATALTQEAQTHG